MLIHIVETDLIVFLVYDDDIIITGNNKKLIQSMVERLHRKFALKDLGELSFFMGVGSFKVYYQWKGFNLSQFKYIHQLLEKAQLTGAKPVSTHLLLLDTF